MPVTKTEWPILVQFLCTVQNTTGMPLLDSDAEQKQQQQQPVNTTNNTPKRLPKGVVLGPDGKP